MQTPLNTESLSPLKAKRARLRAFADSLMETLETIERPKTHIDLERAARAAMMIDRLMVQLYSDPAKVSAPRQGTSAPSSAVPTAPMSRLSTPSSRPAATPHADQDEDTAEHDRDDDQNPLMSEAAFAAWEERFVSHFEDLIEARKQGIALPPEAYELVEDLKARMALLTPPP